MEEDTHSLNNYQNCDIYSFIHEERGDERLHSLVTGSDTSVGSFHHMAIDTLPLVFHTERHGRLICTHEVTDAVRVRVLRVVTPKTSRQRRILLKTRGRERALGESSLGARGWGKTCREAECQKFHTHLETQAPVCGSHQSKTQSLSSSIVCASWTGLRSRNRLKYTKRNDTHETT